MGGNQVENNAILWPNCKIARFLAELKFPSKEYSFFARHI